MKRLCLLILLCILGLNATAELPPTTGALNHPTYFGINGVGFFHRPRESKELEQRWELMRELGVKWDRSDLWWTDIEPKKGEWDFSKPDTGVTMYREHGVQIFPILDYGAAWRKSEGPANDEQRAEWAEYVGRVVSRYKDYTNMWEVWNEPNILPFWRPQPNVEQYAALLRVTARTAREANPDVKLVGFTMADLNLEFLERGIQLAGTESFDLVSYHFYRRGVPEERTPDEVGELKLVLQHYGKRDCPIWVTETGVSSHITEGVSEQLQAVYWMRELLLLIGAGVERVFPFTLVDNVSDPGGEWGAQLGMVAIGGRKKPAFFAYKTMVQELDAYQYVGPVYLGGNVRAMLFERKENAGAAADPQHKLVAWTTGDAKDVRLPVDGIEGTRTLEGKIEHNAPDGLRTYRSLTGERVPLEIFGGKVRVMLSSAPRYIPVKSERLVRDAKTVWEQNPMMASPGETLLARLNVALPDVPTTAITYKTPEGWSCEAGRALTIVIPEEAANGWYTVQAQLPGTSGTVMKDLRVWVRPKLRVDVRPFVTTGSQEIVTSMTLTNLNVKQPMRWSFTSAPELKGVEWPSGQMGGSQIASQFVAESSVTLTKAMLTKLDKPLEIRFETEATSEPAKGRPAFQVAVIPFTPALPNVDGDLADFKGVPSVRVGLPYQQTRGEASSPIDALAVVSAKWTAQGVYVAADVSDANPMMNNAGTGGDVYKGDGVEVYIGQQGYNGSYYANKENGYYHFCLTPGKGGVGAAVSDFEQVVPESRIAVKPRAGGYVMEAFIPATAFGGNAVSAGDVIAWDVQLNDRDDYADGAPQKSFMWNGDDMNWQRAGKWGLAVIK